MGKNIYLAQCLEYSGIQVMVNGIIIISSITNGLILEMVLF